MLLNQIFPIESAMSTESAIREVRIDVLSKDLRLVQFVGKDKKAGD